MPLWAIYSSHHIWLFSRSRYKFYQNISDYMFAYALWKGYLIFIIDNILISWACTNYTNKIASIQYHSSNQLHIYPTIFTTNQRKNDATKLSIIYFQMDINFIRRHSQVGTSLPFFCIINTNNVNLLWLAYMGRHTLNILNLHEAYPSAPQFRVKNRKKLQKEQNVTQIYFLQGWLYKKMMQFDEALCKISISWFIPPNPVRQVGSKDGK